MFEYHTVQTSVSGSKKLGVKYRLSWETVILKSSQEGYEGEAAEHEFLVLRNNKKPLAAHGYRSRDMVNSRGTQCCPGIQVSKTMLKDRRRLEDYKDNIRLVLTGSVGEIQ